MKFNIVSRLKSETAFMGPTHALSALAAFLWVIALWPDIVKTLFQNNSIWIIILSCIVVVGSSLIPDLDNTQSTSKSTLGLFGDILSVVFRISSHFIQTVLRTSKDAPDPNPHRGFWHTIPSALLLGFLSFLMCSIPAKINIGFGETTLGYFFAIILTYVMLNLTLSGLAKQLTSKAKSNGVIGEVISFVVSIGVVIALFTQLPPNGSFGWIGISVAFGCFIHILGDCFTTAGAPILFPFSFFLKGRFWWTTRFTSIKAGGVVENMLFMPAFAILSFLAVLKILGLF